MIRLPRARGLPWVEPGPFKADSPDIKVLIGVVEAVLGISWDADIRGKVIPGRCFGLSVS